MHTIEKITLTPAEQNLIVRTPDKLAYVGIIRFQNGPRGGRYRPIRTDVKATEVGVQRALDSHDGRYKQAIASKTVYLVDHLGNVTA